MSVTNHERPGVYSRYDASTVVKGRGGGGGAWDWRPCAAQERREHSTPLTAMRRR